ncbi:aminotransferase class V-fold PLP-dependent enzyme [Aestuariibacter salexigens]|uniref:aminotransferase class V-fold PLP-dependent enzyme n=1 Tax=Aestuariibacter salexigens TaxID=226010 RepID=UPI000425A5D0|nr:aminotransferase class V-fold PLP-dependent enzyme [Aestuariibacter salexigens]
MSNLIERIRKSVIGANRVFETPFGTKPLVYADYTASGRSLGFIENYIQGHVLPTYANTHTETSFTGAQTTHLREQARGIIKKAVNASIEDNVIFCGSGATTGINKMVDILGLRLPKALDDEYQLSSQIPEQERPVVFIGPYEHHSNELPWRESLAKVVAIPLDHNGQIDLVTLELELCKYATRKVKIGSFSAASNVTGVRSDVSAITALLKRHGALAFWDYAAAGPYVKIDMNGDAPIDAVFISPHKFVGGPGTPGVLVVKQSVLNNEVPAIVGGGTVMYVTPEGHKFIADHERREEGGTPAIVESIRAGLVFKLQQDVGIDTIETHEKRLIDKAMACFNSTEQIDVLGDKNASRLSIFSLRFKHNGKDLHYGFVTALLNDLFGIQVRGGCSCAGPYGHALLDMDMTYSREIEKEIQAGSMILRPGWVRLNFNYFISDEECDYILQALKLVAEFGWRLLPYYQWDAIEGVWRFQGHLTKLTTSLTDMNFNEHHVVDDSPELPDYAALLGQAKAILTAPDTHWQTFPLQLSDKAEALRWFVLPQDCCETFAVVT